MGLAYGVIKAANHPAARVPGLSIYQEATMLEWLWHLLETVLMCAFFILFIWLAFFGGGGSGPTSRGGKGRRRY